MAIYYILIESSVVLCADLLDIQSMQHGWRKETAFPKNFQIPF